MNKFSILVLAFTTLFLSCAFNKKLADENISPEQEVLKLKYFGKVNLNEAKGYIYKDDVIINDKKCKVDLNFSRTLPSKPLIKNSKTILKRISKLEEKTYRLVIDESKKESTVKDFIQFYVENLNEEDYEFLGVDNNMSDSEKESVVLNNIQLRRVGIYPEDKDDTIIFDYTVSKDGFAITNELLVFYYNKEGELIKIRMES